MTISSVAQFHTVFGVPIAETPTLDNEQINDLRISLLDEELEELAEAIHMRDPVAVLDALTDLQYVLDGTYLSLGFGLFKDAAFREVHRSNMSKLGEDGKPIRRADGKILKGPSFTPPELGKVLGR